MENKRCFRNCFSDFKGSLLASQGSKAGVPLILRTMDSILQQLPDHGGLAGVAYMPSTIALFNTSAAAKFAKLAVLRAERRSMQDRETRASFLLGGAGVYAVAAKIYKASGLKDFNRPLDRFKALWRIPGGPLGFLECGSDELFVGRSGYLCAALVLKQKRHMEYGTKVTKQQGHGGENDFVYWYNGWGYGLGLFAEFLFSDEFQVVSCTVENIYCLYESLAGTVCFLVDLLQPSQAEFPLFSIFVHCVVDRRDLLMQLKSSLVTFNPKQPKSCAHVPQR
uniref:LanC like family member 3 n=1 Tax=Leptobrachium leishanense TaxID=445787 RepID=A0A8C5P9E9_9ANUR